MKLPDNLAADYKFLAIIGHPVEHSLSPLMHNTAFELLGLPFLYLAYDVHPSALRDAVNDFRILKFAGFNVTIPHKQAIIPFLDEIDEEAKAVGAVNTVALRDGNLTGFNTDAHGVLQSLVPYSNQLDGKNCLILGAGGAARAVLYALTKHFRLGKIVIAARSTEKATALANSFPAPNIETTDFSVAQLLHYSSTPQLIINTTPVGMHPQVEDSPLPMDFIFSPGQLVFDLIYRPLETTLLKRAHAAGATVVSGVEMLLHQGAKAFEIWTGTQMPIAEVQKPVRERLAFEEIRDTARSLGTKT